MKAIFQNASPFLKIQLLTVATLLCACGGEADDQTVAQFQQEQFVKFKAEKPAAQWRGLLYCAGRSFLMDLDISIADDHKVSGRLSVTPQIERPGKKTGRYSIFGEGEISGKYEPYGREIELAASDAKNKRFSLAALISADGEKAILRSPSCDTGIMASSSEGEVFVENLANDIGLIQDSIRPEPEMTCDDHLKAWINEAETIEKNSYNRFDLTSVLTEEKFIQYFGKPYAELSAATVKDAAAKLTTACFQKGDSSARRQVAMALQRYLTNRRQFEVTHINVFREQVVASWQARMRDLIEDGIKMPYSDAISAAAATVKYRFADVMPEDEVYRDNRSQRQKNQANRYDFRAPMAVTQIQYELKHYAESMKAQEQARRYADMLLQQKQDFKKFYSIYGNILNNKNLDHAPATRVFQEHLVAVAELYTKQKKLTIDDLVYMQGWRAGIQTEKACPEAVKEVCEEVAEIFEETIDDRIAAFVDTAKESFEELEGRDETLASLADQAAFSRAIEQKYRALLSHDNVLDFYQDITEHRHELQDELESELLAELKAQTRTPQIKAFEDKYFVATDLSENHLADINQAILAALNYAQPFKIKGSADYLNALYNQDFDRLRKLDAAILSKIAPLLRLDRQQVDMLLSLGEAITGIKTRENNPLLKKLKNPSALGLVAGAYLLNYEQKYQKCLKPNALKFTYSERTDTEYKNSLGMTMYTIEGATTYEHYMVNPEFRAMFHDYFSSENDRNTANFMDALFNNGEFSALKNGTLKTMKEHDCKSPEIKKMEQGMLAYYRYLNNQN